MACLRRESRLERDVRDEQLLPHIVRAHDIDLVNLLGQQCADELCAAKEAGTLTTVQTELIAMLQSWLILVVVLRFETTGRVKLHSSGPVVPQPGGAASVDGPNLNPNRTINTVIEYDIRDANAYRARIRKFLSDNAPDFPCYKQDCGCTSSIYVV